MNFTVNLKTHTLNKSPNFIRLVERIRQCIREREITKEKQQHMKIYSITHYIEHIKRCMNNNPLIGRALIRFYNIINNFQSPIDFDSAESKISLEDKSSIRNLYSSGSEINLKTDLSKISLTKSTTHFIQPIGVSRQTNGLMTKTTLAAINKVHHQKLYSNILNHSI